jgi:hypothetical protein
LGIPAENCPYSIEYYYNHLGPKTTSRVSLRTGRQRAGVQSSQPLNRILPSFETAKQQMLKQICGFAPLVLVEIPFTPKGTISK